MAEIERAELSGALSRWRFPAMKIAELPASVAMASFPHDVGAAPYALQKRVKAAAYGDERRFWRFTATLELKMPYSVIH
jgi:hypothetical protein